MVGIEAESRRWKNKVRKGDLNVSNEWQKKKVKDVVKVDKIDWYRKIKGEVVKESCDQHVGQIAGWQELSEEKEIRCESLYVMRDNVPVTLTVLMRDVYMVLTSIPWRYHQYHGDNRTAARK